MRWQYNHLNTTPYLHPSKELRSMYNESRSRSETESIMNHMKNHEVFNNKEYKRYFSLSQVIEEDLYGEEEDILNWEVLMDCYDVVLAKKVLYSVKKKMRRKRYDTRRRSSSYLDGDRFVSSYNEDSRKMGKSVPHWLPRITLYTTLTGSFLYLLRYVLITFL